MNTKEKSKGKAKGKAIIGIAMAAIMVASVMVAIVPTAVAVAPGVTVDKATQGTTVGTPVTYIFTVTNLDTFADTFWATYPAPAGWTITPVGLPTAPIPAGGTGAFTLTLTPAVGATPISLQVTVWSVTTGDSTIKTIGCYITPLVYNGLRNVITVSPVAVAPVNAPSTTVLIGQKLDLSALIGAGAVVPATIKGDPTSSTTAGQIFQTDAAGMFDAAAMTVPGTYYINPVGGTTIAPPDTCWGILEVANPTMTLDLQVGGTSVSSITQGTPLQTDFVNNLGANDMVTVKIINPDGDQIKTTTAPVQKFSKVNVQLITDVYGVAGIDTTGWTVGSYTFQVKTAKTEAAGIGARGLSASSNEKTLTIVGSEIAISADKTEVAEEESLRLTVTGVTDHKVEIASSDWPNTLFPGGLDNNPAGDTPPGVTPIVDTIDADGKRTYCVQFDDTGSYTITVTDTSVTPWMTDTVDITVTEKAVTFDIPSTVYIGEKLTIKGTSNTGDTVAIAFDDVIPAGYDKLTIDANSEFSKSINTGITSNSDKLKAPGSVRVKAYINWVSPTGVFPFDIKTQVPEPTDDGSTAILLSTGKLTAKLSAKEVATGDSFVVSGTAEGPRIVEILTVAPRGASGKGLRAVPGIGSIVPVTLVTAYPGCTYDRISVSETDQTYSKKLDVRDNADTGTYLVAVLSRGIDGQYGDNQGANLPDALIFYAGDLSTKTQSQILSILDGLTTRPGSDDQMWVGYIKVETPYVTLNPIESVAVGEPLVVTGESNRKDGFAIVVTVTGPKDLVPQTVYTANETFTATIDTTGAEEGTYTVKADDGDGHTDTVTVDISKEPIPTPTPTPGPATPTPTPTVAPTIPPTPPPTPTPTPAPTPGFEAVFAIAGLLAVAYLVLRRKK